MKLGTIGLLFGSALILYGCPEPPKYPETPDIEFHDFVAEGEIGYLSISFTDGDGDIGLTPEMVDPPFDTSNIYHYNMFVEYWEFNDASGDWEHVTINGLPVNFLYRVPYITPNGKNKALKGTIEVKMEPNYRNPDSPNSDLIRYRIKLVDRALHESEWIVTPSIKNGVVVP